MPDLFIPARTSVQLISGEWTSPLSHNPSRGYYNNVYRTLKYSFVASSIFCTIWKFFHCAQGYLGFHLGQPNIFKAIGRAVFVVTFSLIKPYAGEL